MVALSWILLVFAGVHAQGRENRGATSPSTKRSGVLVRIVLHAVQSTPRKLAGEVRLEPVPGSEPADSQPIQLPVQGQEPLEIRLPPATTWSLTTNIEGSWSASSQFETGPVGTGLIHHVRLWPRAEIEGQLVLPKGVRERPPRVAVRLSASRSATHGLGPRKATVVCPVDEERRWRCALPATQLDLLLEIGGFVPHYRWGIDLKEGTTRNLGKLILRQGASVAGWVEIEEGNIAPGACKAWLTPMLAGGGSAEVSDRLKKIAMAALVREDGFFQITGVPTGSYILQVEQPGWAVAKLFPLQVWKGSETFLTQPLTLRRPLEFDITLVPPLDWLGEPWRVEISRASEQSSLFDARPVFDAPVPGGRIQLAGQAPGQYWIRVQDSLGGQFFSQPEFYIESRAEAVRTIELDVVPIRGRLSLGEDPLDGTIFFGRRHGRQRVRARTDWKGEFLATLPRAGNWEVEVEAEEPRVRSYLRVEVEPDGYGEAWVKVELPDTHLFGRVIGKAGQPAVGAEVSIEDDSSSIVVTTETDGRFELRGVKEGTKYLGAYWNGPAGKETSQPRLLTLVEGQPLGPIELRLSESQKITGQILSPRGPVPGAIVSLHVLSPPVADAATARTELDGTFTAQLSNKAQRLRVEIQPPGHALITLETRLDDSPLNITVPDEGGTIDLSIAESRKELVAQGKRMFLFQNGQLLSTGTLYHWVRGHGLRTRDPKDGLRLPAMAAGEYRLCVATPLVGELWQLPAWVENDAKCVNGYLTPGGFLQLDLRDAVEQTDGN